MNLTQHESSRKGAPWVRVSRPTSNQKTGGAHPRQPFFLPRKKTNKKPDTASNPVKPSATTFNNGEGAGELPEAHFFSQQH